METPRQYSHLSLFSGIGGLDLAAEAAGFTTVGQCEWTDYPTKILERHWPDVPRWRDIRTLTKESFYEKTGLRTVDIISGGFPCQPFSVAGKQKAKKDDRYLWPEMLRVIRELKPRWIVGENVPGIIRLAAWDVVSSLEREGFDTVVFDFEAAAVGALHRRERVAFVAHAESAERRGCKPGLYDGDGAHARRDETPGRAFASGENGRERTMAYSEGLRLERLRASRELLCGTSFEAGSIVGSCAVCNTGSELRDRCKQSAEQTGRSGPANRCRITGQWAIEPDVGRVAHGVPNRVDRLKCLGNAVVPQQFYPIFKAIMEELKREET